MKSIAMRVMLVDRVAVEPLKDKFAAILFSAGLHDV